MNNLNRLFFHPIAELREKYPDLEISKNPVDWDVTKLEWCYYRDTKFKSKLSLEYFPDTYKRQEKKKILLGEIITTLSLFKLELFKRIIVILINEKISLDITLPAGTKELRQLESDAIE